MERVDGQEREAVFDEIPAARGGADGVGEEHQPTSAGAGTGSKHDVYLEAQAGKVRLRECAVGGSEPSRPADPGLQAKIAGLEGVIGRQALELDFFESALRRIRETAPQSDANGESTSTPRSEVESDRKAD